MKLREIIKQLDLKIRVEDADLDCEVTRGYVSDLLSDVMGNAHEGDLWITLQVHQNIIAVAVMKSLAGIILVNNREPEQDTLAKARAEKVLICTADMNAFELAGRLYQLGIKG